MESGAAKLRPYSWFNSGIKVDDDLPDPVHKHPFLGHGQLRIYITGQSGSGKTHVLMQIIPAMCSELARVILCTRVERNAYHNAIDAWCRANKKKFFKVTTPEDASEVLRIIKKEKDRRKDSLRFHDLLIFDDFINADGHNVTNDPFNMLVVNSINTLRNYNFSVIVISQYYTMLPPTSRNSINRFFIFRSENETARRCTKQDVQSAFDARKGDYCYNTFDKLYKKYLYSSKHNYFVVNPVDHKVFIVFFDGTNQRGHVIGGDASTAYGEIQAGNDAPETLRMAVGASLRSSPTTPASHRTNS